MLEDILKTLVTAMLPILEIRGAIPVGVAAGMDPWTAFAIGFVGNMLPVPFIIAYISRIFIWLRGKHKKLDDFVTKMERRAHLKGQKVEKYGPLMLLIFVGIPLPGTGAWTGALIAALLNMRMKQALPCIFLGVLMAAAIITALTFGVIHII